jgi:hypothetical protein
MVIVKVDNKEVKIPSQYSDMTVKQFTDYWKILNKYDLSQEEDIIKRDSDEMDCTIEIVAKLLNIPLTEADRIPYDKAGEVINIFNNMMNNEKYDGDYSGMAFVHNGESYYFPKLSLDKMTFGEYAEVKQLEAILGQEVDNRFDFIPQQMAILCRKAGEGKNDYNRNKREKEFESLTMDIIMQFAFFLSKWNKRLSQSSLISMENQLEQEKRLVTS